MFSKSIYISDSIFKYTNLEDHLVNQLSQPRLSIEIMLFFFKKFHYLELQKWNLA